MDSRQECEATAKLFVKIGKAGTGHLQELRWILEMTRALLP